MSGQQLKTTQHKAMSFTSLCKLTSVEHVYESISNIFEKKKEMNIILQIITQLTSTVPDKTVLSSKSVMVSRSDIRTNMLLIWKFLFG